MSGRASIWKYLALPDEQLNRADLVAMSLAVAKGTRSLSELEQFAFVRGVILAMTHVGTCIAWRD
jgi:hypothetical protein